MSTARRKIAFVTDSTCDLSADFVQTHDVAVVPCFINYAGESHVDNGIDLVREDFYARMAKLRPYATTAAPSPGQCERAIKTQFANADHVMILTAPAKLSGIYNAMRLGAASLPPEQVTLIDSGSTSMGLGYQVQIGVETAVATGDVEATLKAIQAVRDNLTLYAALNTMEFLRASGRVSWAAAGIGALLQIKPIISLQEGIVQSVSRVRTFSRVIDELVELTRARAPLDRLTVIHTNNPDGAQTLIERLGDIAPADLQVMSVTPTLGTHVGPGAVGVVPLSKSWRT